MRIGPGDVTHEITNCDTLCHKSLRCQNCLSYFLSFLLFSIVAYIWRCNISTPVENPNPSSFRTDIFSSRLFGASVSSNSYTDRCGCHDGKRSKCKGQHVRLNAQPCLGRYTQGLHPFRQEGSAFRRMCPSPPGRSSRRSSRYASCGLPFSNYSES